LPVPNKVINAAVLAAFIGIWQVASTLAHSNFFPGPFQTIEAFFNLAIYGDVEGHPLYAHIAASLARVAAGFSFACALGIPLGLMMGLYPRAYEGLRVVIEPIRFIPPIAWIPLVIVLLQGFSRYVFIIWLGAFFPILITTFTSVPRVNPFHINAVKIHGADRPYILAHVVIPSVLPEVLAGMRVGLGVGWMCIIAAEMIGGETLGLGRLILNYGELLRFDDVLVGMVLIGLIGLFMNEIFIQVERRLFKWRWRVVV
jgi:ABC-type nitrate/sulfonate/bicarbonate transport system permease component